MTKTIKKHSEKISGSFNEIIKAFVSGNPKPKQKVKKQKGKVEKSKK